MVFFSVFARNRKDSFFLQGVFLEKLLSRIPKMKPKVFSFQCVIYLLFGTDNGNARRRTSTGLCLIVKHNIFDTCGKAGVFLLSSSLLLHMLKKKIGK